MKSDYIGRQDAVKATHEAIYDFFDVVDDDDEQPMTDLDKKLLEVNKSISKRIASIPTADVVEVVRCKDCDNWKDENGREGLCQVWSDFENSYYRYTPKDGYCSEGEKKEE